MASDLDLDIEALLEALATGDMNRSCTWSRSVRFGGVDGGEGSVCVVVTHFEKTPLILAQDRSQRSIRSSPEHHDRILFAS